MSADTVHTQGLAGDEAELLTGAANALRRGRGELLLAYVLAGYCCREFVVALAKRKVSRPSAIGKLRAALAPEAESKREADPNYLIRLYGSLNLLSGGEARRWAQHNDRKGCKAPAFAEALGVAKAEVLAALVHQRAGADEFAWARDDAAGAQAIFAWACGADAPSLADVKQRVNYYLDPAKGREFDLARRLAECRLEEDYDAVIEWARSLGPDAMMRDDRTVLAAAVEAKARVFPADDLEDEQAEADGTGDDQLGNFPTGGMSDIDLAGAEDPAPVLTAVITHHRCPDDLFARLLKLLVASGDLSPTTKRAAGAALVIISRADKPRRATAAAAT